MVEERQNKLTISLPQKSKTLELLDAVRGQKSRSLVARACLEHMLNYPDLVQKLLSPQEPTQQLTQTI